MENTLRRAPHSCFARDANRFPRCCRCGLLFQLLFTRKRSRSPRICLVSLVPSAHHRANQGFRRRCRQALGRLRHPAGEGRCSPHLNIRSATVLKGELCRRFTQHDNLTTIADKIIDLVRNGWEITAKVVLFATPAPTRLDIRLRSFFPATGGNFDVSSMGHDQQEKLRQGQSSTTKQTAARPTESGII
jgi:hypothetical protein